MSWALGEGIERFTVPRESNGCQGTDAKAGDDIGCGLGCKCKCNLIKLHSQSS